MFRTQAQHQIRDATLFHRDFELLLLPFVELIMSFAFSRQSAEDFPQIYLRSFVFLTIGLRATHSIMRAAIFTGGLISVFQSFLKG
jgi:hypothetical protein